jgi:outer membrane protein assembly factor BamB
MLLLVSPCFAQPTITLIASGGPPTTKLLVSGSGFDPNVRVDIYFDTTDETLVVTDGNGQFQNAAAHALSSAYPGKHWVTALERYQRKGAQEPFLVFTNWSQFQFGSSRTGLNPYENVIDKRTVSRLGVAWSRNNVDAFGSPPALVGGLLYTGSNDAFLYALNTISGALVWRFGGGGSMSGYPAVADGIVYDQDNSGYLYAWNSKTGDLIWQTYSCCNGQSSPAVSKGTVFVTAGDYNLEQTTLWAYAASTGAALWSVPVGRFAGDVSPSSAVDRGTVYVASEGILYAVDAQSGKQLWTYTIGDLRGNSATPSVANGIVYVGSLDKAVYAINASSGALIWRFFTGGKVFSSTAIGHGIVYVGSTDHTLYALNSNTGALIWKYTTGDEIHTSPVVANGLVFDNSYDGNLYAWDAVTGALLWQEYIGLSPASPVVANGVVWQVGSPTYAFTVKPDDALSRLGSEQPPNMRNLQPDHTLVPKSSSSAKDL